MRRSLLAVLVLVSLPLLAQDRSRRVSVFLSDPGAGYSEGSGFNQFVAGVGVAFEKHFRQRWSAELAATFEERVETLIFIDLQGHTIANDIEIRAVPIDLTARYHFGDPHLRWRPYAGIGARWIKAPDSAVQDLEDRVSPQVIVGLDYNITPAWSFRVDAKRLLHGEEEPHDPLLKVSLGAGYRF
jgi:hypothetical protein